MMKVVFYGAALKHPRNQLEVQALGFIVNFVQSIFEIIIAATDL